SRPCQAAPRVGRSSIAVRSPAGISLSFRRENPNRSRFLANKDSVPSPRFARLGSGISRLCYDTWQRFLGTRLASAYSSLQHGRHTVRQAREILQSTPAQNLATSRRK